MEHSRDARWAGGATPESGEPLTTVAAAQGLGVQEEWNAGHCATDGKTVATLRARAALAGIRVDVIAGDDGVPAFLVSQGRSIYTRQVRGVDELRALLDRMTGVRP